MTIVAQKGQAGELWEMTWPAMLRNYLACGSTVACLAFVGWWDSTDVAHYDGAGIGKVGRLYSDNTVMYPPPLYLPYLLRFVPPITKSVPNVPP